MPLDKGNDNLLSKLKELDHKLEQPTVPEQSVTPDQAPVTPEVQDPSVGKEKAFEQYKEVDDEHPEQSPYVIKQAKPTKDDQAQVQVKSKSIQDIEELLAGDLQDMFARMTPQQQQEFREKGEEVAKEIDSLAGRAKLTARKVLHLIRDWLKIIPGINKFFLEQEAKIKTEEVIHYARKRMQDSQ